MNDVFFFFRLKANWIKKKWRQELEKSSKKEEKEGFEKEILAQKTREEPTNGKGRKKFFL